MTFTMWSSWHYLFILSPIIITVLLHYSARNLSFKSKRILGIVLSSIAVLFLFLRNYEIYTNNYLFDIELIPFQVCHFANFVLLFAFIKMNKTAFSLAFSLNMLAAFLSILFADSLSNYANILSLRGMAYIVGHILIVVIAAWAFFNDFISISWQTFKKTAGVILIIFLSSTIINNLFGIISGEYSNYFYTNHPEKGTPLEWFWNWGTVTTFGGWEFNFVYLIFSVILLIFVTYLFYLLAKTRAKKETI